MPFRAIARSHPGRRTTQDDAFLVEDALALFAVADGMGAMVSGRPAADLAVDALREHHRKDPSAPAEELLKGGLLAANAAIFAKTSAARRHWEGQKRGRHAPDAQLTRWLGMGSTLVALRLCGRCAHLAHVGDSRAYRYHRGELVQLTMDHRLVEEARRAGMPAEEIAKLPAGVLVQALGMRETAQVESQAVAAEEGDLFLLASDGLSDALPYQEIAARLRLHGEDLQAAAAALLERAVASEQCPTGGDNVTVVLVRIEG